MQLTFLLLDEALQSSLYKVWTYLVVWDVRWRGAAACWRVGGAGRRAGKACGRAPEGAAANEPSAPRRSRLLRRRTPRQRRRCPPAMGGENLRINIPISNEV